MSKVALYVIPGCVRCRQTKMYLRRHRIAFTEINALQFPKRLAELPRLIEPEFPVVCVGSEVIRGLNLRALSAVLRRNR